MSFSCRTCQRTNPSEALYCYYDGVALDGAHMRGPVAAGAQPFPTVFVMPSGQTCGSFDQLVLALESDWDAARNVLQQGYLEGFLGGMGRVDLAMAAHQSAKSPDLDRGLDELLAKLPSAVRDPAKLRVEEMEIDLGEMPAGAEQRLSLTLRNSGMGLLQGTVSCSETPWLAVGDAPAGPQKMFQCRHECVVPVQVVGKALRANAKPLLGKLVVDTNGGVVEIQVRLRVPIRAFPEGVLAGARTPRQIAEKAKASPKEAAVLFATGSVAGWYESNGWTYPVQGPSATGLGAVQQFFEALGLVAAPKVTISTENMQFRGNPGAHLEQIIQVHTVEKRPVYAHAVSKTAWLQIGKVMLKGQTAYIPVQIPSVPSMPGEELQSRIEVAANGNQSFTVHVVLAIGEGAAMHGPRGGGADVEMTADIPVRMRPTVPPLGFDITANAPVRPRGPAPSQDLEMTANIPPQSRAHTPIFNADMTQDIPPQPRFPQPARDLEMTANLPAPRRPMQGPQPLVPSPFAAPPPKPPSKTGGPPPLAPSGNPFDFQQRVDVEPVPVPVPLGGSARPHDEAGGGGFGKMLMHLVPLLLLALGLGYMAWHDYKLPARDDTKNSESEVPVDPEPYLELTWHEGNKEVKGWPKELNDIFKDQTMRFGLMIVRNPEAPDAKKLENGKRLTFDKWGISNNTVIKVDGDKDGFLFGGTSSLNKFPSRGHWVERGTDKDEHGKTINGKICSWRLDGAKILVTQRVEIVPSELRSGETKLRLDICLVSYELKDETEGEHLVGLRFLLDTFIGTRDDVPFTIPGDAKLCNTKEEFPNATRKSIPDFIQVQEEDDFKKPGTVARVQFMLGTKYEQPDRVLLGGYPAATWKNVKGAEDANGPLTMWNVPLVSMEKCEIKDKRNPNTVYKLDADSAVVMYWDPKPLKAGEKRKVAFTYGLGAVASGGKLLLTVGGRMAADSDFTLATLVQDPAKDERLTIELPPGLELTDGREQESVPEVKDKAGRQVSTVTWRIKATKAGEYTVTVKSSTGVKQTVKIRIRPKEVKGVFD